MADGVTEFAELDPTEMHLVTAGANKFPFLLAKGLDGSMDEVLFEESLKGLSREDAHALVSKEISLITKRARALGLTHLLPEEWNVSKEDDAAKAGVSTDESLSQTREVDAGPRTSNDGRPGDGGEPQSVSFPHNAVGDGKGDTAPDKDLQRGEAGSQTAGAQTNKADGTDDDDDDDDKVDDAEKAPFVGMDNATAMGGADADTNPGNPAWEHKDAALADCASHLILRANELIVMLGNRERAEKAPLLSQETEGAIRQSIQGLSKALVDPDPTVSKEEIEMTNDELIKLLDERDEAARQAKKDRKAAKAATAEKEAAKAGEGTPTATETAEGADASKAAEGEGAPTVESLQKQLADQAVLLEKIAAEDGKHAMLNTAGLSAVLRSPEGESFLKSLEDRVAKAEESGNPDAIRTARHQLTAAKMVAEENGRERGDLPRNSRFGPNSTELFKNTGSLTEDTALHGV